MVQVPPLIKNWIHRSSGATTNGTEPPANSDSTQERQGTNEWDYQTEAIKNAESADQAIRLSRQQTASELAQINALTKRKIVLTTIKCCTVVAVAVLASFIVSLTVFVLHLKAGRIWSSRVSFKEAMAVFGSASATIMAIAGILYKIIRVTQKWIDSDSEDD